MLAIPIELRYAFATENQKIAIIPFCGIGFNVGIKGKNKIDDDEYKADIGGKIGMNACAGLRLRLSSFNVSASYQMPLNNKQEAIFGENGYLFVSIGWGF